MIDADIRHPRSVYILLFIMFGIFIWMFVYNVFAGVPNKNCQDYVQLNITIEPSNWYTNINSGCSIQGCKVGCYRYHEKVNEWLNIRDIKNIECTDNWKNGFCKTLYNDVKNRLANGTERMNECDCKYI